MPGELSGKAAIAGIGLLSMMDAAVKQVSGSVATWQIVLLRYAFGTMFALPLFLAGDRRLPPLEVLRTFAMFRFVLPKALIRTAGGREVNLRSLQAYALTGGLNGIMVGGYLTTGGRDPKEDIRMTEDLGRSMTQPQL